MDKKETSMIRVPKLIHKNLKILAAKNQEYIYSTLARLILKELSGIDSKNMKLD